MNKLILIGNVGRDSEMRFAPSGQPVTSFSVASTTITLTARASGNLRRNSSTVKPGIDWRR
jgi:single-stranded DNA-binding protein